MRYTTLIKEARARSGLTLAELAARVGTSHSTLSAYEQGRKAPTATTLERILDATGLTLSFEPKITFAEKPAYRGRTVTVPSRLPRRHGPSKVKLPVSVFWSAKPREYDLNDEADKRIVYRAVMSEGGPDEITQFIDRDVLLDIFDDMNLPPATRAAWQPVVDAARRGEA